MFSDHLHGAVDLLEQAALELDPKELFGCDAARHVEAAAKAERLAATLKMLLAQRVTECGTWRGSGAVTEEQWLAQVSGTSEAAARDTLATAHRLEELPATAEQLRAGGLSLAQATQVTAAATVDPTSEAKLLRIAEHSGMGRLREEKERVISDGTDVQTVVSTTRHLPKALKIAIDERDQRCKIRGCDNTEHLERHHVDDYANSHDTSYKNVGKVCPLHHDLITHKGYEVVIHDDGTWDLRAPPDEAAA